MENDHDDDLKAIFAELRAEDARATPSFEATLAAARARADRAPEPDRDAASRRLRAPATWWRIAAAVVVVAGGSWLAWRRPPAPVVALTDWRSPTDFLLDGARTLTAVTPPPLVTSTPDLTPLGAYVPPRSRP